MEILLRKKYGAADPSYPCLTENKLQIESALSEAITQRNIKGLKLIIKYAPESLKTKCILEKKRRGDDYEARLITPIHYILKSLRKQNLRIEDEVVKLIIRESKDTIYDQEKDLLCSDDEENYDIEDEKQKKSK